MKKLLSATALLLLLTLLLVGCNLNKNNGNNNGGGQSSGGTTDTQPDDTDDKETSPGEDNNDNNNNKDENGDNNNPDNNNPDNNNPDNGDSNDPDNVEDQKPVECTHVWETTTTPPTCVSNGYDTTACSLCGESYRSNETALIDHIYGESFVTSKTHHWIGCTMCPYAIEKEEHIPDENGMCTICGLPYVPTTGVIYDLSADRQYAEVVGYEGGR